MFKKSAAKLGKKRGGILHVFQKTVNDLEKLDETTKSQIKTQEDKIKKETEEKDALELEQKAIIQTVGKMKAVFGFDEPGPVVEPIPPTEN